MLLFSLSDLVVLLVLLKVFSNGDFSDQKFKSALFIPILGGMAAPTLVDQFGLFSGGVSLAIGAIVLWPLVFLVIGIVVIWDLDCISFEQASFVLGFFLVYRVLVGLLIFILGQMALSH